ncbi:MAG: beta strand repeat-containing protein [Pseudomonadales bacterium]
MQKNEVKNKLRLTFGVPMLLCTPLTLADVVFDGSIGSNAAGLTRAGNFAIEQSDGVVAGQNLFHSFAQFSVLSGESATFTHSNPGLTNIIARVTNNIATDINGLLQTRLNTGGALSATPVNLWLLNPAGIMVGDGAAFDIQGVLNLSATNRIGFANGDDFYSHDITTNSVLSVAEPTTFGFLDKGSSLPEEYSERLFGFGSSFPGNVSIGVSDPQDLNNTLSLGRVNAVGGTRLTEFSDVRLINLSLGGDIDFFDSPLDFLNPSRPFDFNFQTEITAESLRIVALGTSFDGEGSSVDLTIDGPEAITGFLSDASIDGAHIRIRPSNPTGVTASTLEIHARNLSVSNSALFIGNEGAADASLRFFSESEITLDQSPIFSSGGAISLESNGVRANGGSGQFSYIASINSSANNAEAIRINAATELQLTNILLNSLAEGDGDGADIDIVSGSYSQASGQIFTRTSTAAAGGDVSVNVTGARPNLQGDAATLTQGARILLRTEGPGDSGSLSFVANGPISLEGTPNNRHFLQTAAAGISSGNTGSIFVQGTELNATNSLINTVTLGGDFESPPTSIEVISTEGDIVLENSLVGSFTRGNQIAADVTVDAGEQLLIVGVATTDGQPGSPILGAIRSRSPVNEGVLGTSGSILLTGETVTLIETAVNNSTESDNRSGIKPSIRLLARSGSVETISSDILSFTLGDADAGDIFIDAGKDVQIVANDSDANISSNNSSENPDSLGSAGSISVTGNNIRLVRETSFTPPQVSLGTQNCPSMCTTTLNQGDGGDITIAAREQLLLEGSYSLISSAEGPSTADSSAGSITLTGQDILFETSTELEQVLNRSQITTSTETQGNAGNIVIAATRSLSIDGQYDINSQSITESGQPFDVNIGSAGSISLSGSSIDIVSIATFISTNTNTGGDAGNIELISSNDMSVRGVVISSASDSLNNFAGSAGSLNITGKNVSLDQAFVNSETLSRNRDNQAASINLSADGNLLFTNTVVSAQTSGLAPAGSIILDAGGIVSLRNTSISSPTSADDGGALTGDGLAAGDGGTITIGSNSDITELNILGNSIVTTQTQGSGNAGNILIEVSGSVNLGGDTGEIEDRITGLEDDITLNGEPAGFSTNLNFLPTTAGQLPNSAVISSTSVGRGERSGSAGSIVVNAEQLALTTGEISAQSQSGNTENSSGNINLNIVDRIFLDGANAKIGAGSTGAVNGGDISLVARSILASNGAQIATNAEGSANAGNINILSDTLFLNSGASFATNAVNGGGGNIKINVEEELRIKDAQILASSNASTERGDGGTIDVGTLAAPVGIFVIQGLMGASANAGNGGQINIFADTLLRDASAQILVTSLSGNAGALEITAPEQDVSAAILDIDVALLDVANLIRNNCESQQVEKNSSLVLDGQGGLTAAPDDYLSSLLGLKKVISQADSTFEYFNSESAFTIDTPCVSMN